MTKRYSSWLRRIASAATMATLLTGCYIGKAEFRGEEMKLYPLFGTSASPE